MTYAIDNVRELVEAGRADVRHLPGPPAAGPRARRKTYKLKFGHRGGNHPVKQLRPGEVEITSQNHGFAVDPDSLPADVEVTHLNLYDGTVEGLAPRRQAGLLGAVPSRGVARAARRGLLVPQFLDDRWRRALRACRRRTDIHPCPRHRVRADRHRPGLRVRLLGHAGHQGAPSEGLEVVLVNSNPATIMTDPELADRTYVEPLTPEALEQIIEKERPDAMLPTVGGQTALNLAVAARTSAASSTSTSVELIGARSTAIKVAEDRLLFKRRDERDRRRGAEERRRQVARGGAGDRRARPASRRSSARRSRWAASAAASPTTSKSSARSRGAA